MRVRTLLLGVACAIALPLSACGGKEPEAAPEAAPGAAVLWAVGDGGAGTDAARRVGDLITADHPRNVIYLGDVYETGTRGEFDANFAPVYGDLVPRMWPTPGNHDWPAHESGYDPFWRDVLGKSLPHRYTRQAAGWTVISANSETPDDPDQLAWLREQTKGGGTCRLAFWHRPRFNAGEHREEEQAVAPLWDAVAGRAAIVLAGHDHNLQRFKPVDGTAEYVAGAGGRSHYPVTADDPRLAFSDDRADGALRIALTPGRADLRFVAVDGSVLDRSSVTCER